MATVTGWFVHNGGFQATIVAVVGLFVTWLVHRVIRELRRVADLLDTHTKGGLRDVIRAVEGKRDREGSADE